MSRADKLGDPWEIAIAGAQLQHIENIAPITPGRKYESTWDRARRIVKDWRETTFVNCWSLSEHESHALWRVYCPSREGVAIQTTLALLTKSVAPLQIHRVTYGKPGASEVTPTREDLVTKKRPVFEYEKEVRIVHCDTRFPRDLEEIHGSSAGYPLRWPLETTIQSIYVHPDADLSFFKTVDLIVRSYCPHFRDAVHWSAMYGKPPF